MHPYTCQLYLIFPFRCCLCFYVLFLAPSTFTRCFDCQGVLQPNDCDRITECGADDVRILTNYVITAMILEYYSFSLASMFGLYVKIALFMNNIKRKFLNGVAINKNTHNNVKKNKQIIFISRKVFNTLFSTGSLKLFIFFNEVIISDLHLA